MADPEVVQADPHRTVVRIGDTVRRPLLPWSSEVHALLGYLEQTGFPYAPRFLGIDGDGREVLTWLDGESGGDGWAKVVDEAGLAAMARLLRDYHDAVRGYRPAGIADGHLVCHGDFGPWNLVWHGTTPVGILDWDYAWAQPPVHDIAYALEYVAPFRDDACCRDSLRYPAPPDRRRRLGLFADAYGLPSPDGLVDEVIAAQRLVLGRVRDLAVRGQQPQAGWLASGVIDETAARLRWSEEHRHLFG